MLKIYSGKIAAQYGIIAKYIIIMLSRIDRLPLRQTSYPPPPPEAMRGGGCFMLACGIQQADREERYYWDNRTRSSFCLLQYTIAGEGRFENLATGELQTLPQGNAFLVTAPSQTRYWLPPGGEWRLGYILFSGEISFTHTSTLIGLRGHILNLQEGGSAVQSALAEVCENRQVQDYFTQSALLYRLLMTLRLWAEGGGRKTGQEIRPALELLESGYADTQLGVERLAAACGYSRYHFSRIFKAQTGSSPQAYLIKLRLQKALGSLERTAAPAKQIALECGFADYAYFCAVFRRHYGISPGSIRRSRHK